MKIYLPNDADGNVIPSNVKVMYKKDDSVVRVDDLVYGIVSKKWSVRSKNVMFDPSQLYLNKSDNLKRLAADIDRVINHPEGTICAYANRKNASAADASSTSNQVALMRLCAIFRPASTICAVMPNECQSHRRCHYLRAVRGR